MRVGALPEEELAHAGFEARAGAQAERLHIECDRQFDASGTTRSDFKVDFGARSTGAPS